MTELVLEFLGLSLVVAAAGTVLALAADRIAEITQLGRLLIGSLLLAAATSLPELSVDVSAVRRGLADLAVGDLLGSSLMNLLILAVLDLAVRSRGGMLSRQAASHALSGTLSIGLTAIVGLAVLTVGKLPPLTVFNVGGWSWAVLFAYALGARMIFINQRISACCGRGCGRCSVRDCWQCCRVAIASVGRSLEAGRTVSGGNGGAGGGRSAARGDCRRTRRPFRARQHVCGDDPGGDRHFAA